jgi:WD40 repeat protein
MHVSYFVLEVSAKTKASIVNTIMATFLAFSLGACIRAQQPGIADLHYLAPLGRPPANEILWSPEHENRILVSASYANFSGGEIFVLNTETGEKEVLAKAEYGLLSIRTWLSDGESIIIAANQETTGFEEGGLWELSLGENEKKLLQADIDKIISGPDKNSFTVERSEITALGQVKTKLVWIDRITQEETMIVETNSGQTILGYSWSPDGKQLVFAMGAVNPISNFDLYVIDMNSRTVRQLTFEDDNTYPVWSPGNNMIAYRKRTHNGGREAYSLYLIDPNGSCNIKLIDSDYLLSPTWSPDGNKLAFIEPNAEGIFVADLQGFLRNDYQNTCH